MGKPTMMMKVQLLPFLCRHHHHHHQSRRSLWFQNSPFNIVRTSSSSSRRQATSTTTTTTKFIPRRHTFQIHHTPSLLLWSSSNDDHNSISSIHPRRMTIVSAARMSDGTKRMMSSSSSSSDSSNIQSQQRIKRFYKTVQVVPMDVLTSTTSKNLQYPQLPPMRLSTSSSMDTTATTEEQKPPLPSPSQQWYTITLDGKTLRTPLGQVVMIPSLYLAHLMAIEWNSVTTHIVPNQMPMMTYVCTVLDQVLAHKGQYEQLCMQYVMTDTLGYPAHPIEEPILSQQQQKSWLPIQHWIQGFAVGANDAHLHHNNNRNDDTINMDGSETSSPLSATTTNPDTTTTTPRFTVPSTLLPQVRPITTRNQTRNTQQRNVLSSSSPHHSFVQKIPYDPTSLSTIQQYISTLDVWYLLALYIGCKECKSFWLSCALLTTNANHHSSMATTTTNHHHHSNSIVFTPQQIQTAARMEEEMNIQDWGFVEGQHDYDRLNASIQIRSVALFVQSLNRR